VDLPLLLHFQDLVSECVYSKNLLLVSRKDLLAINVNGTMGSSSWLTAVTATITNTTREGLRTYRFNLITFRFVKFFLTDRDSRLYLFFPVNFRIIEQSEFC
jgi:hypothetical protein